MLPYSSGDLDFVNAKKIHSKKWDTIRIPYMGITLL